MGGKINTYTHAPYSLLFRRERVESRAYKQEQSLVRWNALIRTARTTILSLPLCLSLALSPSFCPCEPGSCRKKGKAKDKRNLWAQEEKLTAINYTCELYIRKVMSVTSMPQKWLYYNDIYNTIGCFCNAIIIYPGIIIDFLDNGR